MPCIQTFLMRQSVIGEPPNLIHNLALKRAEIGQLMRHNAPVPRSASSRLASGRAGRHRPGSHFHATPALIIGCPRYYNENDAEAKYTKCADRGQRQH